MEFKHFAHKHNLTFTEVGKENDTMECFGCRDIIYGPAYICEICHNFYMHKSCAELPPQIKRDAFHPHPLRFTLNNVFVCDRCAKLGAEWISYRCMGCTFNLDFRCAIVFSNDYELAYHEALQEERRIKTTIYHFSHNHQLTRCKFSLKTLMTLGRLDILWGSGNLNCMACKQKLHDTLIYACLPCRFSLHESCLNDMPRQVLQSPFHSQHILLPRPIRKGSSHRCSACKEEVKGISFYCNQCDVNLHVSCAKYRTRDIKHNRHDHHLLHLGESIIRGRSCNVCGKDCGGSFFSCIKCDFHIHVECIPLPPSVQHKRHLHPLELTNPFVEDDSGDYYCDMCETKRNGEHHVYYCKECTYIAHIDCVLSEVEPTEEKFLDQGIEKNSDKEEIVDKIMKDERLELEEKIQKDAFHPHPLTLNHDSETMFVCDRCGELCRGLSYNCSLCLFSLDIKCATLNGDLAKHESKKGREINTTIYHFSHNHQLTRCKINILQKKIDESCSACKQDLNGVAYICLLCEFFLHESCLKDMLIEVQSPFHPQHPLVVYEYQVEFDFQNCSTCREKIYHIAFVCLDCNLDMHWSCAKHQTRKIKHNCHDHHLLHLGKSIFVKTSPRCYQCGADCNDTSFCCVECKFYIHLECMPLPYIVKHKRHLHPLTLTNSVVEDDSGEYYCDMCETERNPEHDVYYCKECTYIAHIDCVISEAQPPEEISEYLIPRSQRRDLQIQEIDDDSSKEIFEPRPRKVHRKRKVRRPRRGLQIQGLRKVHRPRRGLQIQGLPKHK